MAGLRDSFGVTTTDGRADRFAEEAAVADMGSLRRGWETGRIGNEMNPMRTQALDAELAGDTPRAQTLRAQIGALEQRQRMYAPEVGRLEDIKGIGDALSYGAAQVGQGAASMIDPMAVSAGLGTVGRIASAIPNPIAKGVGYAAQGAGMLIPAMMSKNQLTGEFIGNAERDSELMARTSKQDLRDMAGNYGALAAIPDSALPGLVGRQISGLSRAEGAVARKAAMGPGLKTLGGMGMEGGTEALQSAGSQQALGMLNPNRDTSGDAMENWNSLAGGALGGGPFAAAGAYAEAGHNRLGAGVDAVKGAAGDVVDLMNESPTVQKGIAKAQDLAKGARGSVMDILGDENGDVTVGGVVGKAKDVVQKYKQSADDIAALNPVVIPPGTDDNKTRDILSKADARRDEAVTRGLTAMGDDAEAQKHAAALAEATDPDQRISAVENAADFLLTRHDEADVKTNLSGWGNVGSAVAQGVGSTAVKFGKGILGIAKDVVKGAKEGAKKNFQTDESGQMGGDENDPYLQWQERVAFPSAKGGSQIAEAAVKSLDEDASYRRALLFGNKLSQAAKASGHEDVAPAMRDMGYQIAGWSNLDKAAKSKDAPAMQLAIAEIGNNLRVLFGHKAATVLGEMERLSPGEGDLFQALKEELVRSGTPEGRALREQLRSTAADQLMMLLPKAHHDEFAKGESGKYQLLNQFERLAGGGFPREVRDAIEKEYGRSRLNHMLGIVNGLAIESTSKEQTSEPISDYDQAAAQKKMDKGGSAIYQFRGTLAPRSGGDIFARTEKAKGKSDQDAVMDGEDITRRPQLFKGKTDPKTGKVTGTHTMPSGDNMLEFKIKEMEDRVGVKRGEYSAADKANGMEEGWNNSHEGYGVDTVSAWDLMKDMTPGRILSLYRDYLRQDSAPGKDATPTKEHTEAGRKATAVGMLLGRLVSNTKKPAGDPNQWTELQSQEWKKALVLAKETGHKGEGPVFESMEALNDHQSKATLKEAEAYFRDHHIVRAYSVTDNNPLEIDHERAMELQKKGKALDSVVRRDADQAGDQEAADQIRSDANLLYFPKGGKDVPIAVRDLVLWAKKASDYEGQTQADDEVSHAPGAENNRYLKDVLKAVYAYAAAHADGMPYKINPGGEQEFFKQSRKGMIDGVPDSLMLQNKSYAESATAGELDAKFKSVLAPQRSIARTGPNRAQPGVITDRASNQRAVRKDQANQEDPFTADPLESVAAQPGGIYVPTSKNEREAAEKLADRLYKENPDTWMDEYKRLAPYPSSSTQFYQPNVDVGTESTTKNAAGDDVIRTGRMPANRTGKAPHEAKTDDPNATEIDFTKGQDPKAEPDEITNQKWLTQQTMEKYKAPTTAMRGMSSAKHNAAGLLRTMMDDPRAGDRETITLLRAALMPLAGEDAAGKRFESYRVAPLINLVSNNHEADGEGFRNLTNAQYFENAGATPGLINIIRRGSAQVLLAKSNMSDANRLMLARQLTGNTALQHKTLVAELESYLAKQGGDVSKEDMAVNWGDPSTFPKTEKMKPQPAPHVAPAASVKVKAAAPAVSAASAQAEFDSVLADMEKDPLFAAPKPAKAVAEDNESSRRARNAVDAIRTEKAMTPNDRMVAAAKARNAAAAKGAVNPEVAKLQAEVAKLQALVSGTTGVAAPAKPAAAQKVAAPPPEGYQVKVPSADLQSKIDAKMEPGDSFLHAINNAITRNTMWQASGEAGPAIAKDLVLLGKWSQMSEPDAKAAAEANNSPNTGRIVRTLQAAGGTGNPLGKPGGAPAGVKLTGGLHVTKDNVKSEQATKFIGRGSAASSTASYAKQWGARANSGSYTSSDRVFISAEGKRNGRVDPDTAEIGKATTAGATILTDSMTTGRERDYNVGERQVAEILTKSGYVESAPGVWAPSSKRNNQAGGDASIRKLLADAASVLDTRTESLRLLNSLSPEDQHTLQNDVLSSKGMGSLLPARMQEGFREWVRDYGEGESAFAWENLHENEVEYLEDILDQREFNDAIDVLMATAILGRNKLNAMTLHTSTVDEIAVHGKVWDLGAGVAVEATHAEEVYGSKVAVPKGSVYFELFADDGDQHSGWLRSVDEVVRFAAQKGITVSKPVIKQEQKYLPLNKQSPDTAEATPEQMAEAAKWLEKVAPGTILKFIKESGYSGEFIEAQNLINVSTTAAAGIMGTTYHEGLHKFFAQFVRSNPKLQKVFERFANDERILARLNELLKDYPAAQAQLVDGEERLAYAFQFWKAGLLKVDNENRSLLQKIGALFRRVLGMVRDSEHALAIFQSFDQGKLAEPSVAAKVIAAQLGKGAMALRARRGLDGMMQGLAAAVLPAETILGQNQHSATARKLSSILFTNPGDEKSGGGKVGYLNAKRSEGKRWLNRANQIFETMDKGDVDAVQKYMQAQTEPADIKLSIHRDAVVELRATLDDFHTYMRDAGLKIGKINKYYPTVWSVDALQKNKGEFIKMLVNKYAQQMNPDGGNAQKAAERIWSALIERNGIDNKALSATRDVVNGVDPNAPKAALREDGVLSPFFAGQEQQTLWWLDGADKEAYQSKNMTHTMSQYFHQGVRAAEYHSRFGENGIKLEVALKKIRAELTEASNKMLADGEIKNDADRVKWLGRQTRDITMAVGAVEGTLGKDITPNMRKFNSYMIAYQNIRLLPYMIFSSFVDPLAQVARGAPVSAALEIFTYGMRDVFRAWADLFRDMPKERVKDEWTKIAEHIGSIEVAMFNHHVAEEYSSVYMSPMARKVNETLFKLNGMEAWDRANRTMATKWAVRFIEQHKGLPDKAHSQRWLTELGLTPATIPVNADGQLITTADELAVVKRITLADAKQQIAPIHAALNRWVEGAVISPNAAQRPGWSSDPNYAAMFHLKQFSYSFQQTIMKRALNELDQGNLRPITALAGFVPTMLCSDLIKGLIQGAGDLPPYMAGMDAGERIMFALKRSGLGGPGDIGVNALEDWSSLGGPAFEQVVDGLRDDIGRTTVKALPLHSMGEYLFSGGKQAVGGPI